MTEHYAPRTPIGRGIDVRALPRGPRPGAREIEVLAGVAEGLIDVEIARRLGLSIGSVRYCVRNCLVKLGAINRPHAVALALSSGLIHIT